MTVLYGVVLGAFAAYFVAAWCVFRRVLKALKARPYHEVREARHNLQYQVGRHGNFTRLLQSMTSLSRTANL